MNFLEIKVYLHAVKTPPPHNDTNNWLRCPQIATMQIKGQYLTMHLNVVPVCSYI